jgi:hypothetical protein
MESGFLSAGVAIEIGGVTARARKRSWSAPAHKTILTSDPALRLQECNQTRRLALSGS